MPKFEFFQNLMVMATSDGQLTEEEIAFLSQRSNRWGITDAEFAAALKFAVSPEAHVSMPSTKGEAKQLLKEMVRVMAVDGELAEIEKNLFAVAAASAQISDDELNGIFDAVLNTKPGT